MAEEKAGPLVVALVAGAVGAGCAQAEEPDAPTWIEGAVAHVDVKAAFPQIDPDPRPVAQLDPHLRPVFQGEPQRQPNAPHPRPLSQGEPQRQPKGPHPRPLSQGERGEVNMTSAETGVASLSRRLEEVLRELDSLVEESLEMQRLLLRLRIRPSTRTALPEEEKRP